MAIRFYNTYSKTVEEFKSIEPGKVRMYNCGPTVYWHPHIGNFRAFIFADLLRRYLEYSGYEVIQVMNITDVGHLTFDDIEAGEDKIQDAAKRERKTPWEIAQVYTNEFFELLKLLNIKKAYKYPKATEHIQEQIGLAKKLVEEGYAYVVEGNVYFDITKFKDYGKLSGNPIDELIAGARVEPNPQKKNRLDFAIWKQDPNHVMQWYSPWGRGFPGWHLECSAMAMKYLGETFDIHTGGEDNIFPHHESEIAQSESATGKRFVNYWLHVRHLLVDGKKMSKSSGNFYTVRDILEKGYDPMVLRYALLAGHYRTPLNFTFDSLESAKAGLQRLRDFKNSLERLVVSNKPQPVDTSVVDSVISSAKKGFKESMDGDLNISSALAVVFDFVHDTNIQVDNNVIGKNEGVKILTMLEEFNGVLGILKESEEVVSKEIESLINEREEARKVKDYKKADRIRTILLEKGIILEDTSEGTYWKRKL